MRAWVMVLLLCAGAAGAEAPAPPRAAESTTLFEALESAPYVVVGTVADRRALPAGGWRARVAVEDVLSGTAPPGDSLAFVWEELAASQLPRFANGERLLLVLEPLAAGTLWRTRIPDLAELAEIRAVAEGGAAFVRQPSLGSVSVLRHYLGLPQALRGGAAGQRHLLALAADGERALAVSAARRLASVAPPSELVAGDAALALRALARAEGDEELASWLLVFVERSQPTAIAPALDAALAEAAQAPVTFVRARGLLGEGLPLAREQVLLASPDPLRRAAAAGTASAAQVGRLAELIRRDPDPGVRAAAIQRLARLEGPGALEVLLDAFDDSDASVRREAALHAAAFGADAVPRLRAAADWPWPASESAIVALGFSNNEASRAALLEVAEQSRDERVRTLADLALGRPIGHEH